MDDDNLCFVFRISTSKTKLDSKTILKDMSQFTNGVSIYFTYESLPGLLSKLQIRYRFGIKKFVWGSLSERFAHICPMKTYYMSTEFDIF